MQRLPILAFALIAASCSQSDAAKPKIGLAPRSADDPSSAAVGKAIEIAARDKAELTVLESQGSRSAQGERASALLEKKLKALAIDPVNESFLGSIIEKAKAKRIPLVFFGFEPSRESMRSWDRLFYVGTRSIELGGAQGEMLAAYWKSNASADRNKDGALQFVALTREGETQESNQQAEAAAKALGAAGIPNLRLTQEDVEGGTAAAREKTTALIHLYGDRIEAVVCRDDETALGAAEALKAAGYYKGRRRVPVVGAGAIGGSGEIPEAVVEAIETETLLGTALPDPAAQGKAIFDLSYALARGTAPWRSGWRITDAKYVWVPCKKLTKEALQAKK
jgi:methyl-galactoside transport system substrate-binding protein